MTPRFRQLTAVTPRTPPSLQTRIFNGLIRRTGRRLWAASASTDAGLRTFRREISVLRTRVPAGVTLRPMEFPAFSAEWVRARGADDSKVVLYFHGGGYFFGNPVMYRGFSWRLSAATGRPVVMVDYRLAPEHRPADALEDALTAYDFLIGMGYAPSDIVVGGDSAGGHLALSVMHTLKRRGDELPAASVAISPWTDLLCTGASHTQCAESDHLIPAAKLKWLGTSFCADAAPDDPLFDPVRGDLTGFPPLLVVSSDTEILRDDSRDLVARAGKAGVDVTHREWNDQAHVFPVFADYVPEAKAAIADIGAFLRSR
ncbi:alpha/beta hydrolase [Actinocorallia sp. API 0066]|uniref:alpha/beta hydrolase n=1 Tax=Actinocorallia sp. API 0066 TaxID=2896846 RepID=UPI001E2A1D28|nr:alpha/beta hydrolase [Actinocorallia sp. API 0066]MCD0447905.1 alpha/beta hydrolase [Actinocorallia sp. API 0066]